MKRDDDNVTSKNTNADYKPASTIPGDGGIDLDSSGSFQLNQELKPSFVKATTRYEILDELGRGGMGIVYRAQDWQLHRHVAIKILRPEFIDQPRLVGRFLDEARIMGTLQHPGIAHVYECGHCDDGRPFHAMMLVSGETLHSILHRDSQETSGKLKYQALNIFAQVCQTVAYAHSRGIVHLDLKPSNVMVGEFGEVYLMDWGLARWNDDHFAPTDWGEIDLSEDNGKNKVQGTLEFMSPEQARGEALDKRTDVFCLGAILFRILTGQTIYQGDVRRAVLRKAIAANLTAAFKLLDQCSNCQPLVRLTKFCLAANPRQRPTNASLLAAELLSHQAAKHELAQADMTRFFDLSLDLFCIAGFDGYFRRINSNFSRVLGYSDQDLLSRPFMEFVHVEDRDKTVAVMGRLLDNQPVVRFRNRYLAADGNYLEFEWTAKSIMKENVIFAVARNLSENTQS